MVGKIEYDILKHSLVPKQIILKEEEIEQIMKKFNIAKEQLPKILTNDAVVKALGAKIGDVIKIERPSFTAGSTVYYRIVSKIIR